MFCIYAFCVFYNMMMMIIMIMIMIMIMIIIIIIIIYSNVYKSVLRYTNYNIFLAYTVQVALTDY